MKKLLFLLIAVLATSLFGMAAGEPVAQSWSFKTNQTATLTSSPVQFNAVTTPSGINGTWTLEFTGSISAQKDGKNGPRFGTTSAPLPSGTSLSLSGSDIPANAVISSVTFTTKGNAGSSQSTWNLSVNGTAVAETKTFVKGNTENSIEWSDLNLVGNEIVLTATTITAGIHFAGVSVTYTENVGSKTEATLTWSKTSDNIMFGENFVAPTLTKSADDVVVTYASDNAELLAVDAETGEMTLTQNVAGTANITASVSAEDPNYYGTPAVYTLTVVDPNAPQVIYSSAMGVDFSFENPADMTVWTHDSQFGLKATAYIDKTNHACDGAMAISPVFDASQYKDLTLDFSAVYNFFGTVDQINDYVSVLVKTESDVEWTKLQDVTTPSKLSYNFIENGKMSLPVSNERIQLAFKYTSTDADAGTWEIKNIVVEGVLGQGKADPGLSFGDVTTFTIEAGQTFNAPTLTKPEGVTATYASSNTKVATVDVNTGAVTLGTAYGTTTITATSEETETYRADRASYTLTVTDPNVLLPAEISYTTASYTVEEYDETFTAQVLNNPHNLSPITYSSNNTESVIVGANDGSVMIFAAGTAEITATFAGNDEYEAATATYTIVVKKAVVPGENVYQMVTSSDQLEAGAKYVIISKPFTSGAVDYGTYVMGAPKSTGKGFEAINLNPEATAIEETYDLTGVESYSEIILSNSEIEGEWYMMIGDRYIDGSAKSNATLGADKKSVNISFNDNFDALIKTGVDGDKDILLQMFAQNSGGKPAGEVFNAYSSNQKKIALFKQVAQQAAPAIPAVTVNGVEITDFESNYNLNKQEVTVVLTAPEGHHVHHKYVVNNTAETPNQLRGITPEEGFTDNNAQIVTLKIKENGDLHFYSIHPETGAKSATTVMTFIGGTTSIYEIGADEAGEAEWFDVQGRRVAKPAKGGVYILKQGSKVSKHIL